MPVQFLALQCLKSSKTNDYIVDRLKQVEQSRDILWQSIEKAYAHCKQNVPPLVKGNGSIFFMIPLPLLLNQDKWTDADELIAIEWLARKHKVVVVGGQCFGATGSIRVSFGNRMPKDMISVAERLGQGLAEMASGTLKEVHDFVLGDRKQRPIHNE